MKRLAATLLLLLVLPSLAVGETTTARKPNLLVVVWDTVRADRMSLYGGKRPTTPFVDEWSKQARIYDSAFSVAGYTIPSHASMFTGLMPSEHCTHNSHRLLDQRFVTLAELLRGAGYDTYAFSANPSVSVSTQILQGFDTIEHPWSPQYVERAAAIRDERCSNGKGATPAPRNLSAAGSLIPNALQSWLESRKNDRPYFVFLNYMEAHGPLAPPRQLRERLLGVEDTERSYGVKRSWRRIWEYTFGLAEFNAEEIRLTRATYDAALLELDEYFRGLIGELHRTGHLDDTIVVLTSDHGEHLGEQHMLDHQYSVYQALLHVPLVIHYPAKLEAGRDSRPAMNIDLFPTLLELTQTESPVSHSQARSLLGSKHERLRYAEDPAISKYGVRLTLEAHPDWDPTPWQQPLRALFDGRHKLIWRADGRRELYDLKHDPLERRDLRKDRTRKLAALESALDAYHRGLQPCTPGAKSEEVLSPDQRKLLKSLGYVE